MKPWMQRPLVPSRPKRGIALGPVGSAASARLFVWNSRTPRAQRWQRSGGYSAKPFDNTAVLRENVEEKYYLEHLELNFQHHPEDEMVHTQMHLTYLPCLAHLRKYYRETGGTIQEAHFDQLIQKIAAASGRQEEVLSWFTD